MQTANVPQGAAGLQGVIDWMGFTNAAAKYEALVAVSEQQGWTLTDTLSHYTATDRLSKAESEMFGIDIAEVPSLFWAYERYENLIGGMDAYFGEFTDRERLDHSEYFRGDHQWSFDLAVGFMASVCGLPGLKCMSWVSKIVASGVRGGLYE